MGMYITSIDDRKDSDGEVNFEIEGEDGIENHWMRLSDLEDFAEAFGYRLEKDE